MRNQHPTWKTGSTSLIATNNTGVYSVLRSDSRETILILVNLTKSTINNYNLTIQDDQLQDGSYQLKTIFGPETSSVMNVVDHSVTNFKPLTDLSAYGINVYQLIP
jgi:hypothetical protein